MSKKLGSAPDIVPPPGEDCGGGGAVEESDADRWGTGAGGRAVVFPLALAMGRGAGGRFPPCECRVVPERMALDLMVVVPATPRRRARKLETRRATELTTRAGKRIRPGDMSGGAAEPLPEGSPDVKGYIAGLRLEPATVGLCAGNRSRAARSSPMSVCV